MRMRGFVAGGLIGIAAGIMLSRRKPDAIEWIVRRADRLMTGAKLTAIEMMLSRRFGPEKPEGAEKTDRPESGKSESGSTWNSIRSLINADARVKHEAERILAEAGDAASGEDRPH